MSTEYKETELNNLVGGETWDLCTTASFGMGMDVSNIELIIQWRTTCNLSALWQHFGRAVRNKNLTRTALWLFAEKDHFDEERAVKAARKA
ncbi:hypothetical protein HD554DRAFT_2055305 [Boletus coccyginus]|nr:hypothetical protein HD554DRAFT_2055305 [Boletus coccyginus]